MWWPTRTQIFLKGGTRRNDVADLDLGARAGGAGER
jgi:hypothetical protein